MTVRRAFKVGENVLLFIRPPSTPVKGVVTSEAYWEDAWGTYELFAKVRPEGSEDSYAYRLRDIGPASSFYHCSPLGTHSYHGWEWLGLPPRPHTR